MLSYVQSSWSWRIGMPFRLIGRGWQSLLGTLRLRRHRLIVDGLVNIERGEGNKFVATDSTCHMLLSSNKGRLPVGWVELTYQIDSPHFLAPSIFADDGHGITEGNRSIFRPCAVERSRPRCASQTAHWRSGSTPLANSVPFPYRGWRPGSSTHLV